MVHLDFAARPDIKAVKAAGASAQGAYVRVRWSVAEEEQGTVDRAAVLAALPGAAEVKLEGRVIPVMRSRAEGISQAHSLGDKVRRWAQVTGVEVSGLLARLERMEAADVDQIVREISLVDRATPNGAQEQEKARSGPDNDTTAAAMIQ
jgi:exonuclease SbcD